MGRIIFDPVLGWRRARGTTDERLENLRRRLVIGANGYRVLPNMNRASGRRLAIFGCSVTEGQWLEDEATYPFLLQDRLRDLRIEPYGIGAYSTFQNLLQLEAYLVTARPETVVFAFIASHLQRNVADPELWIPHMRDGSERFQIGVGRQMNTFRPAAELNQNGNLVYARRYPPKSRAELEGMEQYRPDAYYRQKIGVEIVRQAKARCDKLGSNFFFAVLRSHGSVMTNGACGPDHLDHDPFVSRLRSMGVAVIDADPRLPFDDSTFAPVDSHPNALANQHFADAIGDALEAI